VFPKDLVVDDGEEENEEEGEVEGPNDDYDRLVEIKDFDEKAKKLCVTLLGNDVMYDYSQVVFSLPFLSEEDPWISYFGYINDFSTRPK